MLDIRNWVFGNEMITKSFMKMINLSAVGSKPTKISSNLIVRRVSMMSERRVSPDIITA